MPPGPTQPKPSFDASRRAEMLVAAMQDLSLARSLDAVTNIVRRVARELTGADGATFVLRDGDRCFYADEDAIGPLWKGQRFPLQSCISGWAMLNKQPVVIEDIYDDPRIPIDAYKPTFVKSLAMVPIRETNPLGAIGNYWARHHSATPEQLGLLQILANAASIALENIDLYGRLASQVEELKRAGRAKDEFLMTLSHELRTPLNTIMGWAQLLSEKDASPEDVTPGVAAILRSARTQARIVDDLLDMTHLLTGRLRFDMTTIDLSTVTRTAVSAAQDNARFKAIEIDASKISEVGPVRGDAARIAQVMSNLLSNAIKFSPKNSRIEVSLARRGPNAVIEIKDQGEGMTPEFMGHVFELFMQADGTSTRRHGGLGLGLAIVRAIVRAHDGSVQAQSAGLGLGSTFTVVLPLLVVDKGLPPPVLRG